MGRTPTGYITIRLVAGVSRPIKPEGRFRFKLRKRSPQHQIGAGAAKAAATIDFATAAPGLTPQWPPSREHQECNTPPMPMPTCSAMGRGITTSMMAIGIGAGTWGVRGNGSRTSPGVFARSRPLILGSPQDGPRGRKRAGKGTTMPPGQRKKYEGEAKAV